MSTTYLHKLGPIMQSTIWHGPRGFSVSTINRESSATLAYGHIYAETMVWSLERNKEGRLERDALLWQGEGSAGSIHTHIAVCQRLLETGLAEAPESDA